MVAPPDLRSWSFKDEDELERAVEKGFHTQDEAVAIRAEGERVGRMIERLDAPFCEDWASWKPDDAWNVPVLPEEWDRTFETTRFAINYPAPTPSCRKHHLAGKLPASIAGGGVNGG